MGRTETTKRYLLENLKKSPRTKKELKKIIKANHPGFEKRIKKALRKLQADGEIQQDGKSFRIVLDEKQPVKQSSQPQHVDSNSDRDSDSDDDNNDDEPSVPIAAKLRAKESSNKHSKKSVSFEEPDLDDEIRRLEQELNMTVLHMNLDLCSILDNKHKLV